MNHEILGIVIFYLAAISMLAAILTIVDKYRAKHNGWRIKENTLMLIGALGGSFSMYVTMKIIHHKTLHNKFMIGLPIEMFFDALALIFIFLLIK